MLTLLLFLVMLVCIAFLWNEGLWGNAITLVNLVMAGLIATNYFEPVAAFIEGLGGAMATFTYLWDFLSIWLVFVVTFGVMRTVTDFLTKTKVRFKGPVEHAGRIIVAVTAGYVMMSFTCMTLHMAPLGEHPFRGSFHQADAGSERLVGLTEDNNILMSDKYLPTHFLFLAPDRHWLAAVQSRSWAKDDTYGNGALARWWGQRTFDPDSRFIFKYGARRRKLDEYNRKEGALRVRIEN